MTGRFKLIGKGSIVAPDTTPDADTFSAQLNVEPLATLTFGPLTLTGYDTAATMTALASGTSGYSFDGSTFSTSLPIPVPTGAQIWLRRTASPLYSTDCDVGCTIGGVSFTGHGRTKADPAITSIGPHADWDGTAGSGATAPTDGVRVTKKAIEHFLQPSFRRLSAGKQLEISVKAGAFGSWCATAGIAKVTFSGDCEDHDVLAPTIDIKSGRLGRMNPEVAFRITLDGDAFLAKAQGTATIYATATCVDGTVVKRVISQTVFVKTAEYDWTKYFSLDGRNGPDGAASYVGLNAGMIAMKAAIAGGAGACLLQACQDGEYDAVDTANGYFTPATGYATLSGTGFAVTIKRDAWGGGLNDESGWGWRTGVDGMEFRDIWIDNAFLARFYGNNSANRPYWFNGTKWTDSLGRDRVAANGQAHIGRGAQGLQTFGLDCYYTDCYAEEGTSPFGFSLLSTGCITYRTWGDNYSGALCVLNAFDVDSSSAWFRTARAAGTIAYSGVGGTIAKTGLSGEPGNNGGFGNKGILRVVDAAGTFDITFVRYATEVDIPNRKVQTIAQLATVFNARAGWTMTNVDTTGLLAAYVFLEGQSVNNWTAAAINSTPQNFQTFQDIHGDFYQTGNRENIIISGFALFESSTDATDYSGGLFINVNDDIWIENGIMDAKYSNNFSIYSGFTHMLIENVEMLRLGVTGISGSDTATRMSRCVLNSIASSSPNTPVINDNYANSGSFGTGTNTTGNYTGGTLDNQYVDRASRDYRKHGQVLAAIRAQSALTWDLLGNARGDGAGAGNDVDGAISVNQTSAPVWPTLPLAA